MINFVIQLIKYSISTALKSLGFIPYIVGKKNNEFVIRFLNITTNLEIIIDFLDIKITIIIFKWWIMIRHGEDWKMIFLYSFFKFC